MKIVYTWKEQKPRIYHIVSSLFPIDPMQERDILVTGVFHRLLIGVIPFGFVVLALCTQRWPLLAIPLGNEVGYVVCLSLLPYHAISMKHAHILSPSCMTLCLKSLTGAQEARMAARTGGV